MQQAAPEQDDQYAITRLTRRKIFIGSHDHVPRLKSALLQPSTFRELLEQKMGVDDAGVGLPERSVAHYPSQGGASS